PPEPLDGEGGAYFEVVRNASANAAVVVVANPLAWRACLPAIAASGQMEHQFHDNRRRVFQYSSGVSASVASRSAAWRSQGTVSAPALDRSWSTVAAPLRTTSAHGWATAAAKARPSMVVCSRAASLSSTVRPTAKAASVLRAVKRPLASASLTITP